MCIFCLTVGAGFIFPHWSRSLLALPFFLHDSSSKTKKPLERLTPAFDPSDPFADEERERGEVEGLARKFESKYVSLKASLTSFSSSLDELGKLVDAIKWTVGHF